MRSYSLSIGRVGLVAIAALAGLCARAEAVPLAQTRAERRADAQFVEARRREAEALLTLTDAAMRGRPQPPDFTIDWRNDFLKAQPGTFVPFTVSVDASSFAAASALMFVRVARRGDNADGPRNAERFPFEAAFPIAVSAPRLQITRGFTVPPGDYDVYVALRERAAEGPSASHPRLRSALLKQPISVPDFPDATLSASTVMLADRIERLPLALAPEAMFERPYAIGDSDIQIADGNAFRKNRELLVVFLVYNPSVAADRSFDVRVDYHLFARSSAASAAVPAAAGSRSAAPQQPLARAGERYVSSTSPQRFTQATQGTGLDPSAGHPLLAGQGIPLSSFDEGEYRLGITVTDVQSRQTLSRDVVFRVVGS